MLVLLMRQHNNLVNVEQLLPPRLQVWWIYDQLAAQLAVGPLNHLALLLRRRRNSGSAKQATRGLRRHDRHRRRRKDAELATAGQRRGDGASRMRRRCVRVQPIKRCLLSLLRREAMRRSCGPVGVLEAWRIAVEVHPEGHAIVRHGRVRMRMRMRMRVLRHVRRRSGGSRRRRCGHAEPERVGPVRAIRWSEPGFPDVSSTRGCGRLKSVLPGVGFVLLLLRASVPLLLYEACRQF